MAPTTYSSMKNFFSIAVLLLLSLNFTSCSEDSDSDGDGGEFNNSDLVGEWKATKIVATFDDGDVWNITDEDEIQFQLDGLEWVKMTNSTLTMMESGVSCSYEIKNGYLIIYGPDLHMSLGIESVESNKIVIRFTSPTYTTFVTYKRVD